MALFEIKEGGHYHQWPPFSTLPWVGEQRMERYVTFDASCAYDSAPYNSEDVNKLFGLSFGLRGVHWNSARFGWRWSNSDQCIELLAYCYKHGKRNQDEQLRFPVVAQVKPGEKVALEIVYESDGYTFCVHTEHGGYIGCTSVTAGVPADLPHYGLTHGLYFGGSQPAPHDMRLQIDR
jgi:hypothetical protein